MLRSVKQLYGDRLGASDGGIGRVKDFYFDEQNWAVRYLVAETGTWLTSRQVLLSPHALCSAYLPGRILTVNLTRKQIEDSPPIEWHKPVSRQYEEEYHRYFGWPRYWQSGGQWGKGGLPVLDSPKKPRPARLAPAVDPRRELADSHLRSTQTLNGYHLQARDGIVGQVHDFTMDDKNWAVHHLVVKIGRGLSGRAVKIPISRVERISCQESTVFVNLNRRAVKQASLNRLA
jgi:sporulation protein YlmC with PRC-barrel domain